MPYSQNVVDAIDNLKNLYNGDAHNASTNPGGMGEGGHRLNFEPALSDVGLTGEAVGNAADTVQIQSDDVAVRSEEFRARFLGASSTPLAQDGNGDPVSDGAVYWDSNTDTLRVYSGGAWEAPAAAATDYVPASIGGTFANTITASGGLVGDVTGDITGNAGSATALETPRTIGVSGAGLTGDSAGFDGTGNVALTVGVDNDGHNHTLSTITDAGTIAGQDANAVDVDGGNIDGTAIGDNARSTAKVTTLDANAATTLQSTLDVTGATTLQSSLDVSGAVILSDTLVVDGVTTFDAQSSHTAGVKTNLIQGSDGTLILDADAGDNIEIQVDGTKAAEVTTDGDVIASRYARAGKPAYFSMQWSGAGNNDQDIGANSAAITIDAADVDDPENLFDRLTGEFTAPVDGVYHIDMAFSATAARNLRFMVDTGAGYAEERVLATAGSFASSQNAAIGFMYTLAANDKAKLQLSGAAANSKNGTMFSIGLIA